MNDATAYVYLWNEWLVFPALLIGAIIVHSQYRKASTLMIVVGLTFILAAQAVRYMYPAPLHPVNFAALAFFFIGLVAAVWGMAWFWRNDFRRRKSGI